MKEDLILLNQLAGKIKEDMLRPEGNYEEVELRLWALLDDLQNFLIEKEWH